MRRIDPLDSGTVTTQPVTPAPFSAASTAPALAGILGTMQSVFTTMPVRPAPTAAPAAPDPAPVSGTVTGSDPIFQAIVNGLNAPPSVQLPAMYPGGTITTTPGSSGSRGPLLLAVLVAAGLGVWWFKTKGGK